MRIELQDGMEAGGFKWTPLNGDTVRFWLDENRYVELHLESDLADGRWKLTATSQGGPGKGHLVVLPKMANYIELEVV